MGLILAGLLFILNEIEIGSRLRAVPPLLPSHPEPTVLKFDICRPRNQMGDRPRVRVRLLAQG